MPPNLTALDPLARFRHLAMAAGSHHPIPLRATRFVVRILDGMALVTAERCFRNAEARPIEATLTFPVPIHAALVGLSARIGERALVATAQRRATARATYEDALDRGRTAVLHEEVLRGIHMISVGQVPPGQEVAVTGTWMMPLAAAGAAARLVIPTTVGDVYGRGPLADSDDLVHAPVTLEAELEVACTFGVARLTGGCLLNGRARVRLDAPIEITVTGGRTGTLRGIAADGRVVALSVEPAPSGAADLDGIWLIDTSGSMDEPATCRHRDRGRVPSKLAVARADLEEIAAGLRTADRVALWEFSSEPRPLGTAAGSDGVRRAIAGLSEPDGGTEIGLAIDAVLVGREAADVLIVTDGKSHALDIHDAARRGARFTVVLVGEDSLAANLGHLAVLTGGQVFVSSGADLAVVLGMAVAAMRAPRLRPTPAQGTAPELAEALSGGMRITARWSAADAGEAIPADATGRAVAAYAAWLALPGLEEAAAAAMAEAEGIVCHLTSLVLVDEAGEAQQGIPAQRKVPLMTPGTMRLAHMVPPDAMALPPTSPTVDDALFRRADAGADAARGMFDIPTTQPPASAAAAAGNLNGLRGRMDWTGDLDALRRGELPGTLPPKVLARLRAAARLAAVRDLAAALGVPATAVAVALLARAEAASDRGAARLARAVLRPADAALLAAATRAVGL